MNIKSVTLKNYRCFENLTVNFNKEYTILVGINGSGKSAILDSISVALSNYIEEFDNVTSNNILCNSDAYLKTYEVDNNHIETKEQYPVEIIAKAEIDQEEIIWQKSLDNKHINNVKSIIDYSSKIQKKVREGDKRVILPVIAYYSIDRLTTSLLNENMMLRWFRDMTYIELKEKREVPEFSAVKMAIAECYKNMNSNIKSNELELSTRHKNLESIPLSNGIRTTLYMVADIAYRMAVLNPQLLDKVLETPGVVLIDEVDMHLHPSLQKRIVADLHHIFPKVQFIMTTHSPSILANVKKEHILLLDNGEVYEPGNRTYGREVSAILKEIMHVEVRPEEVIKLKDEFYNAISIKDYRTAELKLVELRKILGDNDADIIQAQLTYKLEKL